MLYYHICHLSIYPFEGFTDKDFLVIDINFTYSLSALQKLDFEDNLRYMESLLPKVYCSLG